MSHRQTDNPRKPAEQVAAYETGAAVGSCPHRTTEVRAAMLRLITLLVLCAWLFWPDLRVTWGEATSRSNWAHGLAVPLAITALLYRRRRLLADTAARGSVWGVALLIAGLLMYAAFTWPIQFGYPRQVSIVLVLAGAIAASCGTGILKRSIPMLLLVWLSFPLMPRVYAALCIRPETYTLTATRAMLDQLPNVQVNLEGSDLMFSHGRKNSVVAQGVPIRGVALLPAYLVIGVFATFSTIRPAWQVIVAAAAAPAVALFCNLLRITTWGLVDIYGNMEPHSVAPRAIASAISLLAAYAIFAAICWTLSHIVVEVNEDRSPADNTSAA